MSDFYRIEEEDNVIVFHCVGGESVKVSAQVAYAAPELLEALEWVLSSESDCDRCRTARGRCVGHTAIAKARGE